MEDDLYLINRERILETVDGKEPDQVPVTVHPLGDWCAEFYGVNERQIYFNPEVMLQAMLKARKRFRGLVSVKPDFSVVIEPSAIGCRVIWPEDTTPYVTPCVKTVEDVDDLTLPNPLTDGLMGGSIETYGFMKKRMEEIDSDIPVEMPYGVRGPFTLAGMVLDLTTLLDWMRSREDAALKLLDYCSDVVVSWVKAQHEVSGTNSAVFLADDFSGYLSPMQFEKFSLPFIRKVFDSAPHKLNTYHNDAQTSQLMDLIPETGANIFHLGSQDMIDLGEAKERIGDRICLMGGVHSSDTLIKGPSYRIEEEARKSIETCKEGGRFILSPGGVVGRGVPPGHVDVLIRASEKFGRY